MSKPVLLSFILISLLWSCQNKPAEVVTPEPLPQRPYQIPKALQEIGTFAEATFTDTTALKQAFTFKAIDQQGKISIIHFEQAAKLYKKRLSSDPPTQWPIFEIKDTEKAVLVVNGRGFGGILSAKVLVDRKNKLILMAEFAQEAESEEYAAEFTEKSFASQFTGKKIAADGSTFGLSQSGKSLIIGQHEIDGISGASVTSRGTIDMMNSGLSSYLPYLFGDN